MANWLKTLWNDLGYKNVFFYKYVIPGLAFFFTGGVVGHLILLNLDTNSLVKNTGSVTDIAIKFEQGTKRQYKYYPLKIRLAGFPEEFRLSDTYEHEFRQLQQRISNGDEITLYTRHKWQTILGWGKQIDIYQIDKDGQTLFELSKVLAEKKSQVTIFGIFSVVLWTWFIINRQIRRRT